MSEGHEKANRRDKTFTSHYWEAWHEESAGLLPSSRTSKTRKPASTKQKEIIRDTRCQLRFVKEMTPIDLLHEKLIHICRSQAGRYEKTFEIKSTARSTTVRRTVFSEVDEAALWVRDAVDFLFFWATRLRALRLTGAIGKPAANEVIEELNYAKSHLGRILSIKDVLASGDLPEMKNETGSAEDQVTKAAWCLIHGFLHLRSSVDLFFLHTGKKFRPKDIVLS